MTGIEPGLTPCLLNSSHASANSRKQPLMAAPKPRVGRLQRQVSRCFMAVGATVRTN